MDIVNTINSYDSVFFDFDGVLVNSNKTKEESILESLKKFTTTEKAEEVTSYFVMNNGLPRRMKIKKYFSDKMTDDILEYYSNLLTFKFSNIKVNEEIVAILEKITIPKYILSGGEKSEIEQILSSNMLMKDFNQILAAPLTKEQNLDKLNLPGKKLFIGDSKVDYRVAVRKKLDFIFYAKYTQESWPYDFLGPDVTIKKHINE